MKVNLCSHQWRLIDGMTYCDGCEQLIANRIGSKSPALWMMIITFLTGGVMSYLVGKLVEIFVVIT